MGPVNNAPTKILLQMSSPESQVGFWVGAGTGES